MGTKRICSNGSGAFDANEVFAMAVLSLRHPKDQIIRSSSSTFRRDSDIVFSSGQIDALTSGEFSAFLFIWMAHGKELCGGDDEVALYIDRVLVQALWQGESPRRKRDFDSGLRDAIAVFNPTRGEPADELPSFREAVTFAKQIIQRTIIQGQAVMRAREHILNAHRAVVDPRVLVLDMQHPWEYVVITEAPSALLVVSPDARGFWRVDGVPQKIGSSDFRKLLPAPWAGLRMEELVQATSVPDAVFAHQNRALCAAKSLQGVLDLIRVALEE